MTATLIGERFRNRLEERFEDDSLNRTFGITYTVRCTGTDRELAALAATGVPLIGSSWSSGTDADTGAICVARSVEEIHEQIYDIECEFTTQAPPEAQQGNGGTPPENLQPTWWWDFETEMRVVRKDRLTGDPIENKAGEPLFVEGPFPVGVLNIERYQTTFNEMEIFNYGGAINSQIFWNFPKESVELAGIRDRPVDIDGRQLRKVQYVLKVDPELWVQELLNHGTRYDNNPPNKEWKNFSVDGNATTGNLQVDGGKLAAAAAPNYINARVNKLKDLNDLNLGPW